MTTTHMVHSPIYRTEGSLWGSAQIWRSRCPPGVRLPCPVSSSWLAEAASRTSESTTRPEKTGNKSYDEEVRGLRINSLKKSYPPREAWHEKVKTSLLCFPFKLTPQFQSWCAFASLHAGAPGHRNQFATVDGHRHCCLPAPSKQTRSTACKCKSRQTCRRHNACPLCEGLSPGHQKLQNPKP